MKNLNNELAVFNAWYKVISMKFCGKDFSFYLTMGYPKLFKKLVHNILYDLQE